MNAEADKSRTQLKKEAIALQKMGEKLIGLSPDQLTRMNLPARLQQAIDDIRSMSSHGARRRQLQHIGSLMRHVDTALIEQALLDIEQGAYRQAQTFKRIETWRDQLVAGDDTVMTDLLETFAHVDRQRLGQLVRSARKEKRNNTPPKSARNLFRYLKELAESQS